MDVCPVFSHSRCLDHDPGPGHPESPLRLRAVLDQLTRVAPEALQSALPAARAAVLRVHPESYLARLEALAGAGGGRLDPDTVLGGASWEAALGGAGAALAAVDSALGGVPAFAAVRPPGHHALADRAMGFCLLANVVIAARAAAARGVERILIVDWDVHHGNGTQALVEADPTIRFVSMHQWPHWPFSGHQTERGIGNIFNRPMRAGLPAAAYLEALWSTVEEATNDWNPGLVLVSAGFDSMRGDLLGGFTLEAGDYAEWVLRIRERFAKASLAAVLEGGYVPSRLAEGVLAVVSAMG